MPNSQESVELRARIQRSFGLLAFIVNRHLIDHMRRIALELDMDFEAAYLYGTLAHLNVLKVISPASDPNIALDTQGLSLAELVPVRLADVVQVSGLPRETVRRKLELLQARCKIKRTPEGLWCYDRAGLPARPVFRQPVRLLQPEQEQGENPVLGSQWFLPVAQTAGARYFSLAGDGVGSAGDQPAGLGLAAARPGSATGTSATGIWLSFLNNELIY